MKLLKKLLYAIAPEWTTALASARARAHSHRVVARWGCGPLGRKLLEQFGSEVQSGPFAGLTLTPMTYAEHLGPFLLGTYESELVPAWKIVLERSYTQIIDIGAKFGYYAVALAKRYPASAVVAFDTDWWARKAIREMSAANEVRNVEIREFCSPRWLARHVTDDAFIISDCEGYEGRLFTPDVVSRLRSATLVIETHDCFVPGVSERLHLAFADSHRVVPFEAGVGRTGIRTELDFLSDDERRLALQEDRPSQVWLLCLPNARGHHAPHLAG